MELAALYPFFVVFTAVLVTAIVALVVMVRVREARQVVAGNQAIAGLYGREVVPVGWCESCRRYPATVRVTVTGRSAFGVCHGCAPVTGTRDAQVRALPGSNRGSARAAS
jgi:hypothetical protein